MSAPSAQLFPSFASRRTGEDAGRPDIRQSTWGSGNGGTWGRRGGRNLGVAGINEEHQSPGVVNKSSISVEKESILPFRGAARCS